MWYISNLCGAGPGIPIVFIPTPTELPKNPAFCAPAVLILCKLTSVNEKGLSPSHNLLFLQLLHIISHILCMSGNIIWYTSRSAEKATSRSGICIRLNGNYTYNEGTVRTLEHTSCAGVKRGCSAGFGGVWDVVPESLVNSVLIRSISRSTSLA